MHNIQNFYPYAIDEEGFVYNIKYGRKNGRWKDRDGYWYAILRKNGKSIKKFIHVLLLETFVGPRPKGYVCRHLDGNKNNNTLENLVWGTIQENSDDMKKHGNSLSGEKNTQAKLTWEKVEAILILRSIESYSMDKLARLFDVNRRTIEAIINGKTWVTDHSGWPGKDIARNEPH